jgi:hypothetical protein
MSLISAIITTAVFFIGIAVLIYWVAAMLGGSNEE